MPWVVAGWRLSPLVFVIRRRPRRHRVHAVESPARLILRVMLGASLRLQSPWIRWPAGPTHLRHGHVLMREAVLPISPSATFSRLFATLGAFLALAGLSRTVVVIDHPDGRPVDSVRIVPVVSVAHGSIWDVVLMMSRKVSIYASGVAGSAGAATTATAPSIPASLV